MKNKTVEGDYIYVIVVSPENYVRDIRANTRHLRRWRRGSTHRNVHQMLKHIVFSQKKAARNMKCIDVAETKRKSSLVFREMFYKTNIYTYRIHVTY